MDPSRPLWREKALPKLKDADRLPDPSTVRRWASGADCSQPEPPFRSQIVANVVHLLSRGRQVLDQSGPLSWVTPALEVLWPLRL
jgi:hypothetical protein